MKCFSNVTNFLIISIVSRKPRHKKGTISYLFEQKLGSFLTSFFPLFFLFFSNYIVVYLLAAFIRVVGSEFVQKYLGEGPRMVRDVFRLAKENSPAIIFVDEIDAIATKRFDAQTGADREVQRILLELLNQMDGFDQTTNVKVIMATNR